VALAINLDDEPVGVAAKIHKIIVDRALPAEMSVWKLGFAKVPP
jgi:hypothetical protein